MFEVEMSACSKLLHYSKGGALDDEQRRRGIQQDDVAPRAGRSVEDRPGRLGILCGRPAGEVFEPGERESEQWGRRTSV